MGKYLIFCLFFCISLYASAQNNVLQGEILDRSQTPIENALIAAFSQKEQAIVKYTYSDENDVYHLSLKTDNFPVIIRVSSLGFKEKETLLSEAQGNEFINFILESKVEKLKKIVLKSWKKIKIDRDTITFRTSEFTDGTEQVVEDLLQNLPGIEITDNGLIKVNGKPIDKLLIEGDDLFDDRYKLLSQNLDASYIEKVQILNNFEDNPIKKSFQKNSQKVALNLLLRDDVKNVWFGKVGLGAGTQEKYEGQLNLGLLKDNIKFFDLANINNTGKLSKAQIKGFKPGGITGFNEQRKQEEKPESIVDIDNLSISRFSENEDVFNNSFLNTLSFTTDLSESTSLRGLTYYTFDNLDKQHTQLVRYFLPLDTISFFEQNKINTKNNSFASEFELKHLTKNKMYITYNLSFEKSVANNNAKLILNDSPVPQRLKTNQYGLYHHLNITKQLSDKNLLTLYAYSGISSSKQNYNLAPVLFQEVFENDSISQVKQKSYVPLEYHGIDLELKRKNDQSVFGLGIQAKTLKTEINSSLFFNSLPKIDSLSNNSGLRNTSVELVGKYSYFLSESIFLRTAVHFKKNYFVLNNDHNNFFSISPEIRLRYLKSGIGTFGLFYNNKTRLPQVENLHESFLLKNYRTFSKGTNKIEPINTHTFGFTYQLSNYKKQFLINTALFHSISDRSYAQELILGNKMDFTEYIILGKHKLTNYSLGISRYSQVLSASIKLSTSHNWIQSPGVLNNQTNVFRNYSSIYRLQGTTYYDFPVNFNFAVQYTYSEGSFDMQHFSNGFWQASLDATSKISKNWIIEFENTLYNRNDENYLFSDISINYVPEQSHWSYRFTANNLINIQTYAVHTFVDFQQSWSSYKIVPRYFLLSVAYRF